MPYTRLFIVSAAYKALAKDRVPKELFIFALTALCKLLRVIVAALCVVLPLSHVSAHGVAETRIERLNHDIEHYPTNSELYFTRGKLFLDQSLWEQAEADFREALKRLNANHALLSDGRPSEQWDTKTHSGWALKIRLALVKSLIAQHQYTSAEAILNELLVQHPNGVHAYYLMAKLHVATHDLPSAARYYDKAIALDANPTPQVYLDRFNVLTKAQPASLSTLERSIEQGVQRLGPLVTLIEPIIHFSLETQQPTVGLKWWARLPSALRFTPKWLVTKARLQLQAGDKVAAKSTLRSALQQLQIQTEAQPRNAASQQLTKQVNQYLNELDG